MGYNDFEVGGGGGGVTLFPYYDLGGAVENFQEKLHRAWGGGGQPFFPEKEKEMKICRSTLL